MWNRLRFIRFLQVSQIFQRRKSDANKQDFENKLNLTCHAPSTPKTTGILTKVFSTSGPNLVALAWTGDELSRGQTQNGVNFDFEVKFDLEGQGQSPPKTIGILTKVFYIYGPNLVILAWTGDELSRGQASAYRTHGRTHRQTDAGNDNTRRPKLASGKKHFNKYVAPRWMRSGEITYHRTIASVLSRKDGLVQLLINLLIYRHRQHHHNRLNPLCVELFWGSKKIYLNFYHFSSLKQHRWLKALFM